MCDAKNFNILLDENHKLRREILKLHGKLLDIYKMLDVVHDLQDVKDEIWDVLVKEEKKS